MNLHRSMHVVSTQEARVLRERFDGEGFHARVFDTSAIESDTQFCNALEGTLPLDPSQIDCGTIHWDSLIDSVAGAFSQDDPPTLLVWVGADVLGRVRPDLVAKFLWILPIVIERTDKLGVRLAVLVPVQESQVVESLPPGWSYFNWA